MALQDRMKYIYLFLTRTGTWVASVIGAVTGSRYAHASIALDRELTEMYSFARRSIHNPLNSGFEKENIHTGIFAHFGHCQSGLYRIGVPDEVHASIGRQLHTMFRRKYEFRYNFLGLISCAFGVPYNPPTRFTCSQFVSWLLASSGAVRLPKDIGLMKPDDLASLPDAEMVYSGAIADADRVLPVILLPPRLRQRA